RRGAGEWAGNRSPSRPGAASRSNEPLFSVHGPQLRFAVAYYVSISARRFRQRLGRGGCSPRGILYEFAGREFSVLFVFRESRRTVERRRAHCFTHSGPLFL